MPVTLEIPEELTRFTSGEQSFELNGATVGQVLESLLKQFPDLRTRLVDEHGQLYPYLPVFVNDRKLPRDISLMQPVPDGARIEIIGLASGG